MKKAISILAFLYSVNLQSNPLHSVYSPFFGSQDASERYQKLVQEAYNDYGQASCCSIPVKKMNSFVSKFIGGELFSFTMFGIWLNEELLDAADESVRTWIIYHEVAHYILGHHAKAIGLVATSIPLFAVTNVHAQNTYGRLPGSLITGMFAYGLHLYALKPYIKNQEKEADLAALRVLWRKNKFNPIISHYLDFLQKRAESDAGNETDGWHYTVSEQYEYLNGTYLTLMSEFRFY